MTSMIQPEIRPGVRLLPAQRGAGENTAATPTAAAPEPPSEHAPKRLSARDAFCLGFAFSALMLIFTGGVAASIDDNVPPPGLSSFSVR